MGAKNLIYDVCKLIGIEVDEKFKLKNFKDTTTFSVSNTGSIHIWIDGEYSFTAEHGIEVDLTYVIMHYDEIIKLPWKPKDGEEYYSFDGFTSANGKEIATTWGVYGDNWYNYPEEIALFEKGWVYRSREEAEAALPMVAKELGVGYEL